MFAFDNTYARDLPGTYRAWQPAPVPAPQSLFVNDALAEELGLDPAALASPAGTAFLSGSQVPDGAAPLAQAYAGHQFGGFSPQLGDGRALLLGELLDSAGRRRDIALKGSGRTPYSRGGDGKAAVGPMLREAILGEAMHALGIPTTRALAVVATGEVVRRDRDLPGAVLTRVASSHLRVGTLQYFAARGELDLLRHVADYAIARHDPHLVDEPDRYFAFLEAVARRQAALVAQWMNVGFIHGVMNTDNMALSGETIDYGPCAFVEAYDPQAVFSSIDNGGRYAFGNQPLIARWNLARLAEALLPLTADPDDEPGVQRAVQRATAVIDAFPGWFDDAWRQCQRAKLGLLRADLPESAGDAGLADDLLQLLQRQGVDFTLGWRRLANVSEGDPMQWLSLFSEKASAQAWMDRWKARCEAEDAFDAEGAAGLRADRMRATNPFVIPRNHLVEAALAAASDEEDLEAFDRLVEAVRRPYDEGPSAMPFGVPASLEVSAAYQTFCGT